MHKGRPSKLFRRGGSQAVELPSGFEFPVPPLHVYAYRDESSGDILLSTHDTYGEQSLVFRVFWEYVTGNALLAALWALTLVLNKFGDFLLDRLHNGPAYVLFVHISDYVVFAFDFLLFIIFQVLKLRELISPQPRFREPVQDVLPRSFVSRVATFLSASFFSAFVRRPPEQGPFINSMREKGMSNDEISEFLRSSGYSEDMIRTLLK